MNGTADDNLDRIPKAEAQADQAALSPKPPPKTDREITEADLIRAIARNEYGLANLFIKLFKDLLIFDHSIGSWFFWNGQRWELDNLEHARSSYKFLLETIIKLIFAVSERVTKTAAAGDEKPADGEIEKKLRKFIRAASTERATTAVLKLARAGGDGLSTDGKRWNPDPWVLGNENGITDLKTGDLRQGKPQDMIFQSTGHSFPDIRAVSALWENEVLPQIFLHDKEMIGFVQRLAGSALVGGGIDSDDIWAICHGEAAAGKGTFLGPIQNALGDYATAIPAQAICVQKNPPSISGPRADILGWMYKRFGRGAEMDEHARLDDAKIKGIVSHELLTGRWPHAKTEITFRPEMTLFVDTNFLPRTNAQDSGVWRRLLVVPFRAKFVDNPSRPNEFLKKKDIRDRLMEEAPGILAWLVRGCLEWQFHGLNPPKLVLDATAQYQMDEDIIGQFVVSELQISDTGYGAVLVSELNNRLREFCDQMTGRTPPSAKRLHQWLKKNHGLESVKSNGLRLYRGISLK